MRLGSGSDSGWRGAALVLVAYLYFLIFAQFAFLKRLTITGVADAHLKAVMAAMAAGGIFLSLLTPRLRRWPSAELRLRAGLCVSAVAAFLSLLPVSFPEALVIASLIGSGLGLLTVTLATHLRQWTGTRAPLLAVGMGTGIGYLICNFPPFFNASPEAQATTAGFLCLAGIGITLFPEPAPSAPEIHRKPAISFFQVLAGFTALVWLDSAAFFIIQNTPALKSGTWQGATHLWANGVLHLAAALASVWLLRRRSLSAVLTAAFVALAAACLILHDPSRALLASFFYPIGVSLYSVALVAYPSLLAPAASVAERGRTAGWIYAIAGWFGSAMGIGMAQHLGQVPLVFVFAAGAVVLSPMMLALVRRRKRELALTAMVLSAAGLLTWIVRAQPASPPQSKVERGRQVYISEGCIHCHSQYVRPNTSDVLMWGPAKPVSDVRNEHPPLIGNRRQGPDLAEVGARRSPLWLKAHFYDPAEVSGGSIMPSYAFLFRDGRGDDLVAYLSSLGEQDAEERRAAEADWEPSAQAIAAAGPRWGEQLYRRHCATCHDAGGRTRLAWQSNFKRLPANLITGPFFYRLDSDSRMQCRLRLARIVKFGIHNTAMAGHEYLSDNDIASITLWLSQARAIKSAEQNPLSQGEQH